MSHEKDRAAHHGDPAQPLSNPTKDCSPEHISPSAELFDNTLQYGDDEHVSITYRDNPDAPVTAAIVAAPDTGRYLREQVPPAADVWFGVNPVAGPARQGKNGAADDVTRLAAIWCDLDYKSTSPDTAAAIIADLSGHLGTQPSAIVNSGNGLHPYWPIEDCPIDDTNRGQAAAVLRRWGRLVKLVARHHNTTADSVFDLPRILRVPGTCNQKYTPAAPVTYEAAPGGPITVAALVELLDDLGVAEHQDDNRVGDMLPVTEPSTWRHAEKPCCGYTGRMVEGWASDNPPAGRHPWLLAQATRLAAAHALGCLTAEQHRTAIAALTDRFTQLCHQGIGGDPRAVKRFEVHDGIEFGTRTAACKTRDGLLGELGGAWEHWHLGAQPDSRNDTAATGDPVQADNDGSAAHESTQFVDGGSFIFDQPHTLPAVWGHGTEVLWAEGESLMIAGSMGLGKTTLAGQLIRARLGLDDSPVLGLPVTPTDGVILYLAMDRPRQIARSLARQFAPADRATVSRQLTIWQGPPPADVAANPDTLLNLALQAGAATVVVDSVKDAAIGLSDDAVGAGYNRARQKLIAAGIELLELHHLVKRNAQGGAPSTAADVYGSAWIANGTGSIIMLTGEPGDAVVGFRHVRQPAEEVGPFDLFHDQGAGHITIYDQVDLLAALAAAGANGLTANAAAAVMRPGEKLDGRALSAAREKARRELDKYVEAGKATRLDGDRGGGGSLRQPTTWFTA